MKVVTIIIRVLLGAVFLVFGLNGFLHFIHMPPPKSGPAVAFTGAMMETGYFGVVAAFQVAGGALLLLPRFVPLGLFLLMPVIVNILCFHIFMDPSGLPMALVVAVLAFILFLRYRANFAGIVRP